MIYPLFGGGGGSRRGGGLVRFAMPLLFSSYPFLDFSWPTPFLPAPPPHPSSGINNECSMSKFQVNYLKMLWLTDFSLICLTRCVSWEMYSFIVLELSDWISRWPIFFPFFGVIESPLLLIIDINCCCLKISEKINCSQMSKSIKCQIVSRLSSIKLSQKVWSRVQSKAQNNCCDCFHQNQTDFV